MQVSRSPLYIPYPVFRWNALKVDDVAELVERFRTVVEKGFHHVLPTSEKAVGSPLMVLPN